MISISANSRPLAKLQIAQEPEPERESESDEFASDDDDDPILDILVTEFSRKDWISGGQGWRPEAGQGDLKGVLSQLLIISIAMTGGVDMPDTVTTLQLFIDLALMASAGVRQVAAKTPGNLLANMETPAPVPQAKRPRVAVSDVVLVAELTRRSIFRRRSSSRRCQGPRRRC